MVGVLNGARGPPKKSSSRSEKGSGGRVVKDCSQLTALGVGLDLAGELDDDAALGIIDDDVDRQERTKWVIARLGQVDRSGRRVTQERSGRLDAADL